jgi:holin-like protein
MKILIQIGIVLGVCLAGELLSGLLPFAFPASVLSMILLFLLLSFKLLHPDHIREKADFLLKNMSFFFIPAGVAIMEQFPILSGSLLPFLLICFLSTILTFLSVALTVRLVLFLQKKAKGGRDNA